jgi:hypothetical protein
MVAPASLIAFKNGTEATDPVRNLYVPPDAMKAFTEDDFWGAPSDTRKVDIVFEKPVYAGWNLTGNLSLNVSVVNRLDRELNLTVNGYYRVPFNVRPTDLEIRDYSQWPWTGRVPWFILPGFGIKNLQFNLTISTYHEKRTAFVMRYYVYARDNNDQASVSLNHTDIVGLGPVSVRILSPAPSEGRLSLRTNTGYSVTVEVRNYSDDTLEGTLSSYYRDSQKLLLRPNSAETVVLSQRTPAQEQSERIDYYFWSNNVSSNIGFDLSGDLVTNITAPHLDVDAIELLRVNLIQYPIELSVPAQVNFSVLSMANKTLHDQRFEVHLHGWMDERVTHRGYFVIKDLVPRNETTVPYKVVSWAGGAFRVHIVTYVDGQRYQFEELIRFNCPIDIYSRIEYRNNRDPEWNLHLGEQFSMKGYIKNLYPYSLHDVTITVMLIADIGGFLSREEFMTVEPRQIKVGSLGPNQTVPFAFNVTQDSAGKYLLEIGVFWGGNATPGGIFDSKRAEVSRPSAIPALSNILPAVPVVAIIPKIIDAVTRRWRKVGF